MATHEVDLIRNAIASTENEIFGEAFKPGDDVVHDETGDRSLEQMGEGLEGQHEPDDEEFESEDEQSDDADAESEGEGEDGEDGEEAEGEEAEGEAAEGKEAEGEQAEAAPAEKPEGRVPSGRLREQTERADKAEKALQALQSEREQERTSYRSDMDSLRRQVEGLAQQRTPPAEPAKPEQPPDLFENPQGFMDWHNRRTETELAKRDTMIANMRVENSLAIAHGIHKEAFEKAFESVNKLNINNPEDRAIVQRIYTAPNPGDELVKWHRRNETLRVVGDDPEKYRENLSKEIRDAIVNDPEVRRQILADMQAEASGERSGARAGKPAHTITRLPKSLNGASGQSSHGRDNTDTTLHDDSDRSVFDSAWR